MNELQTILTLHDRWLGHYSDGQCANLRGVNLIGENLNGIDLRYADLRGANLRYANLSNANLEGADLQGANLRGANLNRANFLNAYLSNADFYDANLSKANLKGADLSGVVNFNCSIACPDSGPFVGWKKARHLIVKLWIPDAAKRCSATSRKCRCSEAFVMDIQNTDGSYCSIDTVRSDYDSTFVYRVGERVQVPNFNDDRWDECSAGIHFFITRQEAVDY